MSISRKLMSATGVVGDDWNLATATFNGGSGRIISISGQATNPQTVFFKPDGTKMYIISTTPTVLMHQYSLGTAWDVTTAVFQGSLDAFSPFGETVPTALFFRPTGTEFFYLGATTDKVYKVTLNTAWDIIRSGSVAAGASVSAQESAPAGLFFKPDGTKMYITGASGDDVNEYNLSPAWSVTTLSFVRVKSVSAQETSPTDVFFKPDGLRMFVVGWNSDSVHAYNLSTAWNISTASFFNSFSVIEQDGTTNGMFFKPDGTKMYTTGNSRDSVHEYSLSTAWNIGTARWDSPDNFFSVAGQDDAPRGTYHSPDGLRLYVVGVTSDGVHEYSLSTPWSVATASLVRSFSVVTQTTAPLGVFFRSDGLRMYVNSSVAIYEYNLSTAWNISTATYQRQLADNSEAFYFRDDGLVMLAVTSRAAVLRYNLGSAWDITTAQWQGAAYTDGIFSVSAKETSAGVAFFRDDGLRMYVTGSSSDSVHEYNLSTAWSVDTASFVRSFSVAAQDTVPQSIFFRPTGNTMYVIGFSSDSVHEYNLSTAWNISTASFVRSFSVAAKELTPQGVFFRPTGNTMYVIGSSSDSVHEYNLSTAWNISTASFVRSFSVVNLATSPSDIFFRSDGLRMYVTDSTSSSIYEYSLGTPWDISTATPVYNPPGYFSVGPQDTSPQAIYVSPTGSHVYFIGPGTDTAYEYALSSPWNLTGATLSESVSVVNQTTVPRGISFKPDGTKMYVLSDTPYDGVFEYDLS
jgi:DNA-binding beta-propeller fold protein YncE